LRRSLTKTVGVNTRDEAAAPWREPMDTLCGRRRRCPRPSLWPRGRSTPADL